MLQQSRRFMQERESWFACGAYRMRYLHLSAADPVLPSLPAVVFVHGLLGYSFSWRHNLEFFAQHREVYAVDLLGIGHSDRPDSAVVNFNLAASALRLLEFLRHLGHSQIDLVGTSHGGAMAMLTASMDRSSAHPVIRRLVLVAPANPFMTNARLRLAFFRTALGRIVMRSVAAHSRSLSGILLRQLYGKHSRITPETLEGYAANLYDSRSYEYALAIVRTWKPDMQQLQDALRSIAEIPTLLLWGTADPAVSPRSGLRLREVFQNAQYVELPRIGHLPYEEAPEEFNRRVLKFLES